MRDTENTPVAESVREFAPESQGNDRPQMNRGDGSQDTTITVTQVIEQFNFKWFADSQGYGIRDQICHKGVRGFVPKKFLQYCFQRRPVLLGFGRWILSNRHNTDGSA